MPQVFPLKHQDLPFACLLFLLQAWVANYERPRMNANSLLASPTGLSPYLRFGCLSCRLFYYRLWDLYKKVRGGEGGTPRPGYSQADWGFRAGQSPHREAFPLASVCVLTLQRR